MRFLWTFSSWLILIFNGYSQGVEFHPEDSKTFQELKKASFDFFEAVKNRDSLGMINGLAEEFTLTSSESNGELLGRAGYVMGSMLPQILIVEAFNLYDFKIRVYGEVAIVQSRIDWKSEYRGQPWNADFLNTDIFVWREKRWQVVHRHSSYPANFLRQAAEMRSR